MELSKLVTLVAKHWTFDKSNYPQLPPRRYEFIIKHILFHQQKACGKLAAMVEKIDHGGTIDAKELSLAIRNFLINTLRLAHEVMDSGSELEQAVREWAEEKHIP